MDIGSEMSIETQNSAFQWGMSTFTTALVTGGLLTFGEAHLDRLCQGAEWLFGEEVSRDSILDQIRKSFRLLDPNEQRSDLRLRVTFYEDFSKGMTLDCHWAPFKKDKVILKTHPEVSASLSKRQNIKIGNYSEEFRLKRKLNSEVLFYNDEKLVGECSVANILFLFEAKPHHWVDPVGNPNVLRGIGLTQGLKDQNLDKRKVHLPELKDVRSAALVNALKGVQIVDSIDGMELCTQSDAIEALQERFFINQKKGCLRL